VTHALRLVSDISSEKLQPGTWYLPQWHF